MNKKAVFLTNSLAAGGAEKVISVIVSQLVKEEYDIELICLEKNIFYEIPKNIKITYLTTFNGSESGLKKLLYIPILALKLRKHARKNNIKLIQSHVYRANYINILSNLFGSKHIVQIVNAGTISKYYNEGMNGKVNLLLIKYLYKKANLIILKAKGMQNDMNNLFTFKSNQIVINNPYDIEKIKYLATEKIDDFNFQNNKKYIISVGRFETFKKQDYIIKALSQLSNEYELILIGEGNKKDSLIKLCKELNLLDKVHFLGRINNPYKYIAKSNYYILSSDNGEGFPNVLLEAMICKVPIISSDCVSGPREILAPDTDIDLQIKENIELSKYGILFPIGNFNKIVEAINILENDILLKNEYIKKASKRAEDFSLNNIISQYKKVLNFDK